MVAKGLAIWLLVLITYGSAGSRIKRTILKSLFSSSNPPVATPYPIWKVHRYTGIQLQPFETPHKGHIAEGESPSAPYYPVNEPDIDEEEPSSSGGLETILSLIPGGLSGLIGLSGGSGGYGEEREAEDRLGLEFKKNLLTYVYEKKKNLLTALKRDAIHLLWRKAQAKKAWIKNLLLGNAPGSSIYYSLPYYYPKMPSILSHLPFVGHWFGQGDGPQLPEVQLPVISNLVTVKDPPYLPAIDLNGNYEFPHQTGTYLKVDFPGKDKPIKRPDVEYHVPGTSYAFPENPVPVPEDPSLSHPSSEPVVTTAAPEIFMPSGYAYSPELSMVPHHSQPAPVAQVFPYPVSYPYPLESYPYAPSDYYNTPQSEFPPVNEWQMHRNSLQSEDPETESVAENRLDEVYEEPTEGVQGVDGDIVEKKTENIGPR